MNKTAAIIIVILCAVLFGLLTGLGLSLTGSINLRPAEDTTVSGENTSSPESTGSGDVTTPPADPATDALTTVSDPEATSVIAPDVTTSPEITTDVLPVTTVPETTTPVPDVTTSPEITTDAPPVTTVPETTTTPAPDVTTSPEITTDAPPVTTVPETTATPAPDVTTSPEITTDAPTVTTSPEITTSPESTSPLTPDDLSVTSGRIDKQVDGKGWFSVTAEWSVVSVDGDSVNVRIYLSVTCYSMQIGTRDCTAAVGGVQYPFESDPISIPYTGKKQTMLIGSVAVKVPLSGSAVRVDFPFKGTYSGVYYGTVTLEGLIDFN